MNDAGYDANGDTSASQGDSRVRFTEDTHAEGTAWLRARSRALSRGVFLLMVSENPLTRHSLPCRYSPSLSHMPQSPALDAPLSDLAQPSSDRLARVVREMLVWRAEFDISDLLVEARHGVVILSGTVPTKAAAAEACRLARSVVGVREVDCQLATGE